MNDSYKEPIPRVTVETTPVDRAADYAAAVDRLGFDIAEFRVLLGADNEAETVTQKVELVAPVPMTAIVESAGEGRLVLIITSEETGKVSPRIIFEAGEISLQTDAGIDSTVLEHDLTGIQAAEHLAATLQKVIIDRMRQ